MSLSFTLLCYPDGFAQTFEDWEHQNFIPAGWRYCEPGKYAIPEMFLSMILFRASQFPEFRHLWIYGVQQECRACFRELPSYSRFDDLKGMMEPNHAKR
ncbi:MAG: hypothetical protein OXF88_22095 [Rhodobacteraceae bacterium]|nr:hypothetical protein [Paracoccaceae bacterium]MCY4138475.1 hypothetical protein [Paracoccaceae bacterium]